MRKVMYMTILSCLFGMCTGAILMWFAVLLFTGKRRRKNRRGFSDRMYIYNVIFVTVTVILSFVAMFLSGNLGIVDLSPISVIVPAAFGELAIHTGFMVWKAKVENCRKNKDVNRLELLEGEIEG